MSKSITKKVSKKKKLSFPSCYTIMLIVLVLVMGLTYIVPSGKYATLSYNVDSNLFTVTYPNGDTLDYDATQGTLNELGVKIDLEKFTDESIWKPVGIPGTYEYIEKECASCLAPAAACYGSGTAPILAELVCFLICEIVSPVLLT